MTLTELWELVKDMEGLPPSTVLRFYRGTIPGSGLRNAVFYSDGDVQGGDAEYLGRVITSAAGRAFSLGP